MVLWSLAIVVGVWTELSTIWAFTRESLDYKYGWIISLVRVHGQQRELLGVSEAQISGSKYK